MHRRNTLDKGEDFGMQDQAVLQHQQGLAE